MKFWSIIQIQIIVILFFSAVNVAAKNVVIDSIDQPLDLSRSIQVLADPSQQLTMNELIAGEHADQWQVNDKPSLRGSEANTRYWFRIDLELSEALLADNLYFTLISQMILLEHINVWVTSNEGGFRQIITGYSEPYASRDVPAYHYYVKLPRKKNITVIGYLQNTTDYVPITALIRLLTRQQMFEQEKWVLAVQVAFYAVVTSLFIYNLCMLFSIREKLYAYYIFFLVSAAIGCLFIDGTTLRIIFPHNPALNRYLSLVLTNALPFSYLLFVWCAIDGKRLLPKAEKIYHAMVALGIAIFIYNALAKNIGVVNLLIQVYSGLVIPLSLLLIIEAIRRSVPIAALLLIAEAFALTGSTSYLLLMHGILLLNDFTYWAIHWGFVSEALLLSLAVAARTNIQIKEKYLIEKQMIASELESKAKSQFFASMSHEFRTPLSAILGYTDLANRDQTTEQDRRDHLTTIDHCAQHLLQLINDILDLSKIEAQQLDVESIAVDVTTLVQQVINFIRIQAEQKNIYFVINYQYPLPKTISSDPTRLKQALVNLCSNAVKFTQTGGVTLSIACDKSQEKMIFAIKDTGIGLKAEQIEKLFRAFAQADSSTSRTFGGTGLGLHLSKLIANKLGGDIVVKSQYGQGSIFTLSVNTGSLQEIEWLEGAVDATPNNRHFVFESKTKQQTMPCIIHEDGHFNVLLADDNVVNQKLVAFYIKQLGAEVVIANDGLEVIAEVLKGSINLALIDMDMPIMDGLAATTALRAKGYSIPIYALTGNVDPESIHECQKAGCDGHLSKPLDTEKLSALIQALKAHRTEQTNSC